MLTADDVIRICTTNPRKQQMPIFVIGDAERWKWIRDHWDEVQSLHFPKAGNPTTAANDPAKLTAYVDDRIAEAVLAKAASGVPSLSTTSDGGVKR
jgi:hypothetical protein